MYFYNGASYIGALEKCSVDRAIIPAIIRDTNAAPKSNNG